MSKKHFSESDMMPHSEAKVELLKRYIGRYVNILAMSPFEHIKLYDLFCGVGMYPTGGKGSPLAILDAIKQCLGTNFNKSKTPSHFYCHFNDEEASFVEKSKQAVEQQGYKFSKWVEYKFTNETYQLLIPIVTKEIGASQNTRAFVFIDPCGYSDVSLDEIRSLLDTGKGEVLLFWPMQFMYRFTANATPSALGKILMELFGTGQREFDGPLDFIEQSKLGLRKWMGPNTYVSSFTIQKDTKTAFAMFFFGRNEKGLEAMLQAKWEVDDEYGNGWSFEDTQPRQLDIFPLLAKNQYAEDLTRYVLDKARSNHDIYLFTLRQDHLPKHTNYVLRSLQKNNQIQVRRPDGTSPKKGGFFITYKDTIGGKNPVTIQKV